MGEELEGKLGRSPEEVGGNSNDNDDSSNDDYHGNNDLNRGAI